MKTITFFKCAVDTASADTVSAAASRVLCGAGALVLMLVVCAGCAARESSSVSVFGGKGDAIRSELPGNSGNKDLLTINSLHVARVQVARELKIDSAKVERFNDLVIDQFSAESGIDVFSDSTSISPRSVAGTRPERKSVRDADAVLQTEITRYAEASGSALGASRAALFAARFSIVRASDRKEIWATSYFSTEHPDSINLIEVTQRIGREKLDGMPSADSLAAEAARGAALDFSRRRVEQFSRK